MHTRPCTPPTTRRIKLGSYSEADARRLVREMVRAVAQCHGMNVMLRDIKPENVSVAGGAGRAAGRQGGRAGLRACLGRCCGCLGGMRREHLAPRPHPGQRH